MSYKDRDKQLQYQRDNYYQNKDKWRIRQRNRRAELKQWFLSITQGIVCSVCGEPDRRCLDFHHTDPTNKLAGVSRMLRECRSKQHILDEIKKCIVLCSNCHRKKTL